MNLLEGHKEIDAAQLYIFKHYLSEFWNDFKKLKIAHNPQSRMQNILGVEDERLGSKLGLK